MTLYVALHEDYTPFDCEMCGPSYDQFYVDYDEDGWNAVITVGCTGGDSIYDAPREKIIAWLEERVGEWDLVFDQESLKKVTQKVREA